MTARARALAAAVLWLAAAGCTDTGSLPTAPATAPTADDPWTRLHPTLTHANLQTLWGADADDMWFAGDDGVIVHFDGDACELVAGPSTGDIIAMHGCARTDIWAVDDHREVLHWDGRRWSAESTGKLDGIRAVCCAGPGEVYVGGHVDRGEDDEAVVLARDGNHWRRMPMIPRPTGSIRHLWGPDAGLPLLAATGDSVFVCRDGTFVPADLQAEVHDADGDLVLAQSPEASYWHDLWRVGPDGSFELVCGGIYVGLSRRVTDWHRMLVTYHDEVWRLDDCIVHEVHDTGIGWLNDVGTPALAGSRGPFAFVAGHLGQILRLSWEEQDVRTEFLNGPDPILPQNHLVTAGGRLYASGSSGRLIVLDGLHWREVPAAPPLGRIRTLADGRLAGDYDRVIAAGDPATGAWQTLPAAPFHIHAFWIDTTLEPVAVDGDNAVWTCREGAWEYLADPPELSGFIFFGDLEVVAADAIYLRVWSPEDPPLHVFDGTAWQAVPLPDGFQPTRIGAGPLTRSLYIVGNDADGNRVHLRLRSGEYTTIDHLGYLWDEIHELTDGRVFAHDDDTLYELVDHGWNPVAAIDLGSYIQDCWIDPALGVYLLTSGNELYHRPLPEGSP